MDLARAWWGGKHLAVSLGYSQDLVRRDMVTHFECADYSASGSFFPPTTGILV
jgi:hypothetical protein